MAKILFTSPWGPYPKRKPEHDPLDYFYYRNTLKQGAFQLRSFQSWHPLHLLAQNCPLPSVVLDNPVMDTFKAEMRHGRFDMVAVAFTVLTADRVYDMVKWIREEYPDVKIVLGGYGTAMFREPFELSEKIRVLVDYICFGEGLAEFAEIIEKVYGLGCEGPLTQQLLPAINSIYGTKVTLFKQLVLVGGLGCTYGCSFCATSGHFNRRYIPLFTGERLFECLLEQAENNPGIQSAVIYDEDFLSHKTQVMVFMNLFRNSVLAHRPFFITVFSSLKSVVKYTIEELVMCGIGTIFIGVETLDDGVLEHEGLAKRQGDIETLFRDLHAHGINTLGSLVLGWDTHTEEIIQNDVKRFIALNPTFYQIIPLHTVPGTGLWEKLKAAGRIPEGFSFEADNVNSTNFEPFIVTRQYISKVVSETYKGLVDEGGPWPFRIFENLMQGYVFLKHDKRPVMQQRALLYKRMVFPVCVPALFSILFFPFARFMRRWVKVMRLFAIEFPQYFVLSILLTPPVIVVFGLVRIYGMMRHNLFLHGDQPDFTRTFYKGKST